MSSTRCKAVCTGVQQNKRDDGTVYSEAVILCGVYSEDPASENKWFAQATPCFQTQMTIDNPAAFGSFVPGNEYYVDFIAVAKPEPTAAPQVEVSAPVVPDAPPTATELPSDAVATPTDSVATGGDPVPETPAPAPAPAPDTPPQA